MNVRRRPPNLREKAQEAATGREDNQATAKGQEKKSAATGDNELASEATGPIAKPPSLTPNPKSDTKENTDAAMLRLARYSASRETRVGECSLLVRYLWQRRQ